MQTSPMRTAMLEATLLATKSLGIMRTHDLGHATLTDEVEG